MGPRPEPVTDLPRVRRLRREREEGKERKGGRRHKLSYWLTLGQVLTDSRWPLEDRSFLSSPFNS